MTHSPEEYDECVGLRECEEDEGEEGGDGAVEDGGPDLGEGVGGALAARAEGDDVGVGDVRVVVDAEADHQHDGHARDRVDGQAPEEGQGGNSLENSTQRESLNEKVISFSIALTVLRGFPTPFNGPGASRRRPRRMRKISGQSALAPFACCTFLERVFI